MIINPFEELLSTHKSLLVKRTTMSEQDPAKIYYLFHPHEDILPMVAKEWPVLPIVIG